MPGLIGGALEGSCTPPSMNALGCLQPKRWPQAFLLLLERLTPDERAAYLLRTVFDYEYAAIGEMVEKPEATVRQLVSRARRRLGLEGEPRFRATAAEVDGLVERFIRDLVDGGYLRDRAFESLVRFSFWMLGGAGLAVAEALPEDKSRVRDEWRYLIGQAIGSLRVK